MYIYKLVVFDNLQSNKGLQKHIMEKHIVKVLKTELVTHNVKRFTVEKPAGYTFTPGQATDVSINKPALENELRPFTFTCLDDADYLEFTIKIYTDHDGVTSKLLNVNEGDELIIHEVFGAIHYRGPGLFIAGGAGLTPFIAILRKLKQQNQLAGQVLLFANRSEKDIIIKDELDEMLGANHIDVLSNPTTDRPGKYIDTELLKQYVVDSIKYYYICGPDNFTTTMVDDLVKLGISKDRIVLEE
jgi:ferredoxin-NADP reductase